MVALEVALVSTHVFLRDPSWGEWIAKELILKVGPKTKVATFVNVSRASLTKG